MLLFKIGFLDIGWIDALDMLLVGTLLYQIYVLVRGGLASRVFLGYLLLYLFYLIVKALGLELLTKILEYFMGVGALALIIIFQQEIRRFLLFIGKSTAFANNRLVRRFFRTSDANKSEEIAPVLEAVKTLSAEFMGSLIVIKKTDELDNYIETGELVDAVVSKRLIASVFNEYSALHEGAIIISNQRLKAAGCILPVSDSVGFGSLGFRHRAALGMSEATDAAVIVVSEETGRIALAIEGKMYLHIALTDLDTKLNKYLFGV